MGFALGRRIFKVGRMVVVAASAVSCGGGGGGSSTAAATASVQAATVPGAPIIGNVSAGDASVSISFTAPASNGGAAISGYGATCVGGTFNVTASGAASPITVAGLVNGLPYACSVAAVNSVGSSTASSTATVTPNGAIVTPTGVAANTTLDLNALANYANPALPAYYDGTVAAIDNTPAANPISNAVATLGRVLFYDKRLSLNDTVSCASCHQQARGFGDKAQFSAGFTGSAFTAAHAMRIGNVRYYRPGSMFWDKRAASVELQASQPIQHPVEMGWDVSAGGIAALLTKMGATTYYPDLFNFAFGTPVITEARIQQALAQFERALVSTNSKWDTGYATVFNAAGPNRNLGVDLPNFTAQENQGRTLFLTNRGQGGAGCIQCHIPPTFALTANSRSNGLDPGETRIFKSPSLKNVGVGGPYMHDGRFTTLEQVVDFYDNGIVAGPALDNDLKDANGAPQRLNLSAAQKAALAAFMRTLDDPVLIADAKFSNPMR
jgi:cytochrome c peroxidase